MSEPLIFRDENGRELTRDDLAGADGRVRWEIAGTGHVPAEAVALHQEARALGSRGEYERAFELFDRAQALAPDWPYPSYDKAYSYLLQGDAARAEALYAEVDRMSPRGFFTCKTSLDILRRERLGEIPPGFSKAFATVEWIEDRAERRGVLMGVVEKFPRFAPAWKELAALLSDPDDRLAALERGLAGEPDVDALGGMLIDKAQILHGQGHRDDAVTILGSLVLDPDSSSATEAWARFLLAQWFEAA